MSDRALDRLTSGFLVSWVRLTTPLHGGDLILLMALSHLIALSGHDRPVSASSIARGLGLPRRTVLRKIDSLVASGRAVRLSDGFAVGSMDARDAVERECRQGVALRAREFLGGLFELGVSDLAPARLEAASEASTTLFEAANLLCLDLLVQIAAATEGDPMLGVVFLAICDANTRHIDEGGLSAFLDFQPGMPDEVRRSISMLALSQALAAPRETARRYANRLVAVGACKLVRGGLIANEELFTRPAAQATGASYRRRVRRFVSSLAAIL